MSRTMEDHGGWRAFVRPDLRVRFDHPVVTPHGRVVEVAEEARDGGMRVHLTAPGSTELYVELVVFAGTTPEQEYERHRDQLTRRFGPSAVTDLTSTRHGRWQGWAYAFHGNGIQRSVLLLPVGRDTCRIVHDPRSQLSAEVVATVVVVEGPGPTPPARPGR
jgi:hypothetical protein